MSFKSESEPIRPSNDQKGLRRLWYPAATIYHKRIVGRGPYYSSSTLPKGAVIHFTASGPNPYSAIAHAVERGYNYIAIGADGEVVQASPLNEWGYHAGVSKYPGIDGGVSDELLGIEVCCAGILKPSPGKQHYFQSWFGKEYHESEVRHSKGQGNIKPGFYHKFTEAQESALVSLLCWLKANDPNVFNFDFVIGHDECAPDRKFDPGASLSMPMAWFRGLIKQEYARRFGD